MGSLSDHRVTRPSLKCKYSARAAPRLRPLPASSTSVRFWTYPSSSTPVSTMASRASTPSKIRAGSLQNGHYAVFERALWNVLFTKLAEFTMAQLVDGLPTIDAYLEGDGLINLRGHPIFDHEVLCPGALERTKAFRSEFDPSTLLLKSSVSPICPGMTAIPPPLFPLRFLMRDILTQCNRLFSNNRDRPSRHFRAARRTRANLTCVCWSCSQKLCILSLSLSST